MKTKYALIPILILLVASGWLLVNKPWKTEPGEKIVLATSKNLWNILPHIAKEKGFFKEEGLAVEFTYQAAGKYCMDAVLSGDADIAAVVEVNLSYLGFTGERDFETYATIVKSDSSALIGWKSTGISGVEDLKGKRIGYSPGTTSDLFLRRLLAKNNITANQVTLQAVQPNSMQSTILGKGVDAVSTWQPFIENSRRGMKGDYTIIRDSSAYTGYMLVGSRKSWSNANQEKVRKFIRALKKASDYAKANPEESQQIMSAAIGMDIDIVKSIWNEFDTTLSFDAKHLENVLTGEGKFITENIGDFEGREIPLYSNYLNDSYITE